jgi:hypothetical protein
MSLLHLLLLLCRAAWEAAFPGHLPLLAEAINSEGLRFISEALRSLRTLTAANRMVAAEPAAGIGG